MLGYSDFPCWPGKVKAPILCYQGIWCLNFHSPAYMVINPHWCACSPAKKRYQHVLSRCVIKVAWKKEHELSLSLFARSAQEGMLAILFDQGQVLMLWCCRNDDYLCMFQHNTPQSTAEQKTWGNSSNISVYQVLLGNTLTPITQEHLLWGKALQKLWTTNVYRTLSSPRLAYLKVLLSTRVHANPIDIASINVTLC